MTTDAIAVTGIGLITPAGPDAATTWQRMLLGTSVAASDPELAGLRVTFSCRAREFDADAALGRALSWRLDRFVQMAVAAARQAITDARLDPVAWDPARVGVVVGASANSEGMGVAWNKLHSGRPQGIPPMTIPRASPNMAAGEVSLDLNIQGPGMSVSTACASGATALAVARDLLRAGTCDIVLAGGSDSATLPIAAGCFDKLRALSRRTSEPHAASRPFDADRDGFVLGEGAAMLVLERAQHARARHTPIHAYLAGAASTCDAYHPTASRPDGSGSARAIRLAVAQAGLAPEDIDHVNAHGTATRLNDLSEARALGTVFRTPPPVTAPKSVLGHAISGAGAIEAALTVLTLSHQTIPPTANLDRLDPDIDLDVVTKVPRQGRLRTAVSNSFGFGGQNTVLLFTAA
ncbi:beta-ketoacyl-[acyl-carrier-protein] synthase family protein [Streptomyces aurantiacus]|uniref:Putative 3-oxoacyl-[acyl-carrier-protein] synthase 2 n=1 Tax=Streptomyces aurantiacus JA 4570 TaxID=1286094 RepID=S4AXE8_9ACTN|nr:beta-ketoacyl-[acyl-carrier-protein] synthase family protein [Streptomyces aurantiacus]EPH46082.1 putative 3-oxoacyl-[acyl-carrier-protein] synthase 2 [Streptomyces aurantiacus JA 4570]